MFIGAMIVLNLLAIGVEIDWGYRLTTEEAETFTSMEKLNKRMGWYVLENFFLLVFLFEACVRLQVHRCNYFWDAWNWIDLVIVSLSIIDSWVLTFMQSGGGFEARAFFGIKIIRMLRLLRFVRLLRMFQDLWLIVQGLLASLRTLVWVIVLLLFIIYIFGVFCTIQIGQSDG